MNMYFVALVAPAEINEQVLKWKNFFKERYQCIVALKSPAHITLVPPFWMKEETEDDLKRSIGEFCISKKGFDVLLNDFAAFKPRVIYVDISKNELLNSLHESLIDFLVNQNKYPVKKED